jgi:preprotein translocase subunit SecE
MVFYLKLSKVMVVESIMTIYIYIFDYLIYVQFKINMNE